MDGLAQFPSDMVRTLLGYALERAETPSGTSQAGCPHLVLPANRWLICSCVALFQGLSEGSAWLFCHQS